MVLLYAKLKARQIEKAEFQCQQLDQPADDFLVDAFGKLQVGALGGTKVGDLRTELRTPIMLKPLLELLLSLPPELSAWLVRYRIEKAMLQANLPIELQGDILMAFEAANYILPEKTREAACHLACALCILPSLNRARATLANLGVPLTEKRLSQEDVTSLIEQGYLPHDILISTKGLARLGWNLEMRTAVARELKNLAPEALQLFQIDKMQKKELQALRRWAHNPDPEADDLLQQGTNEADLEKAYDLLTRAGQIDPILMPDVLRNQAWILAKWGRYEEAVSLLYQALEVDPEYGEVWYHLGICLAKLRRFTEALHAFEKAKSLGFRKPGLEPNMATCRRAIANGSR